MLRMWSWLVGRVGNVVFEGRGFGSGTSLWSEWFVEPLASLSHTVALS